MRKTILVVEDDAAIGEVLHLMLLDAGYVVELQMDGQTTLQMAEPFPDLLFLDIRLSGTDGRAMCQHLKGPPATRHIPIILLSAFGYSPSMDHLTHTP
ncbi:MAG TPA: response regulator [Ktedonobacteraceae bacterium]|nr:response regulator [Ktedonobacteraceae bacterium]